MSLLHCFCIRSLCTCSSGGSNATGYWEIVTRDVNIAILKACCPSKFSAPSASDLGAGRILGPPAHHNARRAEDRAIMVCNLISLTCTSFLIAFSFCLVSFSACMIVSFVVNHVIDVFDSFYLLLFMFLLLHYFLFLVVNV